MPVAVETVLQLLMVTPAPETVEVRARVPFVDLADSTPPFKTLTVKLSVALYQKFRFAEEAVAVNGISAVLDALTVPRS